MSTNQAKSSKVILSPVFANEEQERLFAECAKEAMSTEARLSWNDEDSSKTMPVKTVMSPVFSTRKQEEFFAKCAQKEMSTESRLKW